MRQQKGILIPSGIFVLYVAVVSIAFWFESSLLYLLGLPWSQIPMLLSWMLIHTSSAGTVNLLFLLSTVPNGILLLRWIAISYASQLQEEPSSEK